MTYIEQTQAAAKQGDAAAQFDLGFMYYFGRGFKCSEKQAAKWFKKAAEQGHVDAQKILADRD